MNVRIRTVNTNLLILLICNELRCWALSSQIAQKLCVAAKLIYPTKYVVEKYSLRTRRRPYFDLRCITMNQYSLPRNYRLYYD
jgi:hypothetical protein